MYDPVFIMNVKTVVTVANVVLLVLLLAIYIQSYRQVRSKFTFGLIIFAFLLLLHAITSTPCVYAVTCEQRMCIIELFDIVPDILELMALMVLLYLSSE